MNKLRTYSPYYKHQLTSSPYATSSQLKSRYGKQIFSVEEKKNPLISFKHKKKSKSFESLSKEFRKDVQAAGDFYNASKEISEKLSEFKHLNSKACQTICQSKKPAFVVKRHTHDECHLLTRRRSSSKKRYFLKLSNKTFYATLQHEIDGLKKEKEALENESMLHGYAILKILKNQSDDKRVIMALIEQNQKLEQVIQRKESLLNALSEDIRELKSNQPIFMTYFNHEIIMKSHQKLSKSHPIISIHKSSFQNPNTQTLSVPIISRHEKDPLLSKTSIDSELNYQIPTRNSDILTDTEILNKHVAFQKTAATNYSIYDCPSSLYSSRSSKRIKSRTWTKFICCK